MTGARVGEAIRLDRDDVELTSGVVRVKHSKFGKSRELLLHRSSVAALRHYATARDRLCLMPKTEAFFISLRGNRLIYETVWSTFSGLTRAAGLKPRSGRCRPTVHSLRHSFAVRTLLDWHLKGADVQALLPLLSTWMGHTDPAYTYWYLSAAPELLALVARRIEQVFEDDDEEGR